MRLRRFALLLLILGLFAAQASFAQAIRLSVQDVPLEQALNLLRSQSGVDIVFAQRLVQDRRTTCTYSGARVEEALACVLRDTGVRYEVVRARQFVLISTEHEKEAETSPVARGVLSGFVADEKTREVLPVAQVYLPALRLGTVTNTAGYFAIPELPVGSYEVVFSYVGYEAARHVLTVNAPAELHLLRPVTLEAEEVVVEGRRERVDLAAVSGATRVPGQALEALPAFPGERDLFKSLQWLPGVNRPGELNGTLVVRGGEADQNLYLLDGVPVYHPWHAFSLISTFQTETFKDVRLYRSVYPAEHGGRLSSVLDTQLKDGSRAGPGAVAALSLLSGRLMVETPVSQTSSLMVSARRSYLDQITGRRHPVEGPDGRRDTLRTGYHFYDLSGKFTYQPRMGHRLSVSYYQGRDRLDLRLPFDVSLDFSSWLRPADLFFEIDQDWGNRVSSVRYQYLHSPRLFVTGTAYLSAYYADEGAFIQPTTTSTLASDYTVRMRDLGVRVDLDWYQDLSHQVRTGIHFVNHRLRSALDAAVRQSVSAVDVQQQESDLTTWELSAYAQDIWQPTPRWQIMPGIRGSFFASGGYAHVDPSLSIRYEAVPQYLALRTSVGTQVQYMHLLRDRYSFMYDLVSSRWIPASEEVRPSSSVGVVAGLESRPRPWLSLSSEAYWRFARNVLLPEDAYQTKDGLEGPGIDVGTLLGQYTMARSRSYGIELSASVEQDPWHIWLAYSGGRAFNQIPSLDENGYHPSRFDVPRAFQGTVTYAPKRWEAAVSLEARSGYPHSVPVARYVIGDPLDPEPDPYLYRPALNNGRLPPYARVDVSAGYHFKVLQGDWHIRLFLYNVLNHRNVISRTYDPRKPVIRPIDRKGLPFLPLLELEVRL